jgi:hypothetical protein
MRISLKRLERVLEKSVYDNIFTDYKKLTQLIIKNINDRRSHQMDPSSIEPYMIRLAINDVIYNYYINDIDGEYIKKRPISKESVMIIYIHVLENICMNL